jgi:hypothetical protein
MKMMMKEDQIVIKACEQIVIFFFSLSSCDRNLRKPECERAEMENFTSCSASGSKCH